MPIIELHGGQFQNQGALQMLSVASAELRERLADVTLVVDRCVGTACERESLDLRYFVIKRGWMGSRNFRWKLALQKFVPPWPAVWRNGLPLSSVDALVDLSGFAFSDQWGPRPLEDFSRLARSVASRGRPVILLPQAFGPFVSQRSRQAMRGLAEAATVIYARDRTSLVHITEAVGELPKVLRMPDITLARSAIQRPLAPAKRVAYIVPNVRLWERDPQPGRYATMLVKIASRLRAYDVTLAFLIHDRSGADRLIAETVNKQLAEPLTIFSDSDPWETKERIGQSMLVIGSRFHSLVAALSKGVPVIALGWSHKYDQLLEDFGMREYCIALDATEAELDLRLSMLCDADENFARRVSIVEALDEQTERLEAMWQQVASLLNGAGQS